MKKGNTYHRYTKNKDNIVKFKVDDEDYENIWTLQKSLDLSMSEAIRVALRIACTNLPKK